MEILPEQEGDILSARAESDTAIAERFYPPVGQQQTWDMAAFRNFPCHINSARQFRVSARGPYVGPGKRWAGRGEARGGACLNQATTSVSDRVVTPVSSMENSAPLSLSTLP